MTLITYLTRVHFADDVLEEALRSELEMQGRRRPLVVIDGATGNCPNGELVVDRILGSLPLRSIAVLFERQAPVATGAEIVAAARTYVEEGCDVIVASGDASTIGLARLVQLALAEPDDLAALPRKLAKGSLRAKRSDALADLIAIPDIGSSGAVIADRVPIELDDGTRRMVDAPDIPPRATICDPTLTLRASPCETACSAVQSVSHCIEAYVSRGYNPPAEGIALDGLRRVLASWKRVNRGGSDLEARRELMAASLNGALAVQKGLGACHASAEALRAVAGGLAGTGGLQRIVLPEVVRLNRDAAPGKFSALDDLIGCGADGSFGRDLQGLLDTMALPTRLSELGLTNEHLVRAANVAAVDRATGTNPRAMDASDYLAMMRSLH